MAKNIELSETSPEEPVKSFKQTELFVSCSVEEGKLRLIINSGQRPDVKELPTTEEQGDHVTAYASFIASIVNASNDLSFKDVPQTIINVAKAILPELENEFDIEMPKTHNRDKRKKLTAILDFIEQHKTQISKSINGKDKNNQLSLILKNLLEVSEEKEAFKSDLKDGALSKYATVIETLTNKFLTEMQSEKLTALPSKGRVYKEESPDGSTIDQSSNALNALNYLYKVIRRLKVDEVSRDEVINIFKEISEDTSRDQIKLGFNYLNRSLDKNTTDASKLRRDAAKETIKQLKTDINKDRDIIEYLKKLEGKLVPFADTISWLFANLFDFNRKVKFGEKQKVGGIVITNVKEIKINKLQDLYTVVARHIVIMFNAFPEICKYFHSNTINHIVNGFLKCVLKDKGWSACKELGSTEEQQLNTLKAEVDKRVNSTNNIFNLKIYDPNAINIANGKNANKMKKKNTGP